MTTMTALLTTDIPLLSLINRGKVRDVYSVDASRLLFVATDRISAFDVVMPNGIPDKGRVLTQISLFWFDKLSSIVPNHVIPATGPSVRISKTSLSWAASMASLSFR